VVRLLGQRRPSGTAAALLDFLSSAGEEKLAREVHFALAEVAHADGKPDQALEDALNHKDTVRRDAARVALAKDGGKLRDQASRRLYLAGVKVPTRITEYRDGKKIMNWERLEVWFFNKFEEAVFAKP
jgi:hypothetical protein